MSSLLFAKMIRERIDANLLVFETTRARIDMATAAVSSIQSVIAEATIIRRRYQAIADIARERQRISRVMMTLLEQRASLARLAMVEKA